jgi:hypothetical protein
MLRCGWGHVNAIRKTAIADYYDSLFDLLECENARIFAAQIEPDPFLQEWP